MSETDEFPAEAEEAEVAEDGAEDAEAADDAAEDGDAPAEGE